MTMTAATAGSTSLIRPGTAFSIGYRTVHLARRRLGISARDTLYTPRVASAGSRAASAVRRRAGTNHPLGASLLRPFSNSSSTSGGDPKQKPSTSSEKPATPEQEESSKWSSLRVPFLFGAGLYVGMALFGSHRKNKDESQIFAWMQDSFHDRDKWWRKD